MSGKRVAVLGGLSMLLVFALVQTAFAESITWKVTQLTSSSSGVGSVRVSGDRVAWVDGAPGGGVWTWTSKETTRQISVGDDGVNGAPSVDGDRIAWLGYKSGVGSTIRLWTLGSDIATVSPLTTFSDAVRNAPLLSGSRLAWVDQRPGESHTQVYTWKVGDSETTTLSDAPYGIYDPVKLSGDRVTWGSSTGHAANVFTRVVGDAGPQQISDHVTDHGGAFSPDVSSDHVVWYDNDDATGTFWTLRLWNSDGTSLTVGPAPNDGFYDPHVSGDRVVWRSPDGTGISQVVTWKVGDSQVTTLTSGGVSAYFHTQQQVSGDRVVWRENDGSYYRIMTWTPTSGVTTLSGDYQAYDPMVSGDRVVWRGYVNGIPQVFTAAPQPPLIATTLTKPKVSPSKPKHGKYASFTTYLTPGLAANAGAKVTLVLSHQETKSVRKKVKGKWRTVKVKYWHVRKTATMVQMSTQAMYWVKVKLAYKGSWQATAKATAGIGYLAPSAKTLTFTVK